MCLVTFYSNSQRSTQVNNVWPHGLSLRSALGTLSTTSEDAQDSIALFKERKKHKELYSLLVLGLRIDGLRKQGRAIEVLLIEAQALLVVPSISHPIFQQKLTATSMDGYLDSTFP